LSVGATNDGSDSSSLKASLENGHTPGLAKAAVIFFAVKQLDMQHLSVMPSHGLLSLYWD
jgi:hypothetical protein